MRRLEEKLKSVKCRAGSALVLVVVVTVMLAVVGVMFVMMARVDSIATSAISENRELLAAVDTVVERINTVLVDDLFARAPADFDLHLFAEPTPQLPPPDIGRPDYSNFDIVNEPWDAPLSNTAVLGLGDDPWLASLEPVEDPCSPGDYYWRHISDIYGIMGPFVWNLPAIIAEPSDANDFWQLDGPADADGDGVEDSRWVRLPISSSKGRPIFAAVRIIDNCGMLNLNTAHSISANSEGQYLSSVDYERFLRGREADSANPVDRDNIRRARKCDPCAPIDTVDYYHDVIMNIENPGLAYCLFDIGDELEIRNRYLLTSRVEARFERHDVANYTLDAGGGIYAALEIPRTNEMESDGFTSFDKWKWRMDHRNFDGTSGGIAADAWKYDRRHVCTFYSFDRNLRRRTYPFVDANDVADINRTDWLLEDNPVFSPDVGVPVNIRNDISSNTPESRRNILHLLYALRAYFLDMDPDAGYQDAARRSAQVMVNMIDYMDTYSTVGPFYFPRYGGQTNEGLTYDQPTYINRDIIRELILEVSTYYHDVLGIGNVIDIDIQTEYDFGLGIDDPDETIYGYERQPFISELYRSYDDTQVPPEHFAIELCNPYLNPNGAISLDGWQIDIGGVQYDLSGEQVEQASSPGQLGRLVIRSNLSVPVLAGAPTFEEGTLTIGPGDIVKLQRRDPADPCEYITVDATDPTQTNFLLTPGNGTFVSKRDDTAWKFTNSSSYTIPDPCDYTSTLGDENGVSPSLLGKGFQMPVPNNNAGLATLHYFEMVLSIGNEKIGEEPNAVTNKVGLAVSESDVRFDIASRPELLEYICFMNRPQRNLPGRININTATMEVIRAAIPPEGPVVGCQQSG